MIDPFSKKLNLLTVKPARRLTTEEDNSARMASVEFKAKNFLSNNDKQKLSVAKVKNMDMRINNMLFVGKSNITMFPSKMPTMGMGNSSKVASMLSMGGNTDPRKSINKVESMLSRNGGMNNNMKIAKMLNMGSGKVPSMGGISGNVVSKIVGGMSAKKPNLGNGANAAISKMMGSNIAYAKGIDLGNKQESILSKIGMSNKGRVKGASIAKQREWRDMPIGEKVLQRMMKQDRDKDNTPDIFDCQPNNPLKQEKDAVNNDTFDWASKGDDISKKEYVENETGSPEDNISGIGYESDWQRMMNTKAAMDNPALSEERQRKEQARVLGEIEGYESVTPISQTPEAYMTYQQETPQDLNYKDVQFRTTPDIETYGTGVLPYNAVKPSKTKSYAEQQAKAAMRKERAEKIKGAAKKVGKGLKYVGSGIAGAISKGIGPSNYTPEQLNQMEKLAKIDQIRASAERVRRGGGGKGGDYAPKMSNLWMWSNKYGWKPAATPFSMTGMVATNKVHNLFYGKPMWSHPNIMQATMPAQSSGTSYEDQLITALKVQRMSSLGSPSGNKWNMLNSPTQQYYQEQYAPVQPLKYNIPQASPRDKELKDMPPVPTQEGYIYSPYSHRKVTYTRGPYKKRSY